MPLGKAAPGNLLFLELDGTVCGALRSFAGGTAVGEVVVGQRGPDGAAEKHLGAVHYEDLVVELDLSHDEAVYTWIGETWHGRDVRRDGAVITADAGKARSEREFFQGLISEVTFPKMDGTAKDAASLRLRITPEYTRSRPRAGESVAVAKGKAKAWLRANFRFEVPGLDCTEIVTIDPLTVTRTAPTRPVGESRDYLLEPSTIEFPNLRVTMPEASASSWMAWRDDFVVNGYNGSENEREGSLTFLGPNLKDELGRLRFFDLGIFRLAPELRESGSDEIPLVVAELYCERMELDVG